MSGSALKIICCGSQPFRVVPEATKPIIAGRAQEPTNAVASVAVIDCQVLYPSISLHSLRVQADCTNAFLDGKKSIESIDRDPIADLQIVPTHPSLPFLQRVTFAKAQQVYRIRRAPLFRSLFGRWKNIQVLYSEILGTYWFWVDVFRGLSSMGIYPDRPGERKGSVAVNRDTSTAWTARSPVSSDLANIIPAVPLNNAPSEYERMIGIVNVPMMKIGVGVRALLAVHHDVAPAWRSALRSSGKRGAEPRVRGSAYPANDDCSAPIGAM